MTGIGVAAEAVRAFAFAEPVAGGRWGAAWLPPGASPTGVLGVVDQADALEFELTAGDATEPWRMTAQPDTELTLDGLGEPVWSNPEVPGDGFQQLCRVTGTLPGARGAGRIECLGWRSVGGQATDPSVDSFRLVAGWFDEHDGFSVFAGRPRRAKGQDEDIVAAALFDSAGARVVADPRLSTTYADSGAPTRAGVELWVEGEADPDLLYPRRAMGQALRPPVQWSVADVAVEAQDFHWFSGGREGAGVYLLGQR